MAQKALVIFSGGPDSTAAAIWAVSQGFDTELVTFQFKGAEQYGELLAAMTVAKMLGLKHDIIDFRSPLASFAPNVHILMHAGTPEVKKDRTIPHRTPFGAGMILATAASYALYNGFDTLVWGATREDRLGGNPEYSQDFADRFADLILFGTKQDLKILVPFDQIRKHELFEHFKGKEGIFAQTWSCKLGGKTQSGHSTACIARRTAAHLCGLEDYTIYESKEFVLPLTKQQLDNPHMLTDDDMIGIMASEDAREK